MANISVTYTFSNSTTADATQVNQNFTDIINGTSDGTKDFSISALTCAGNATFNANTTIGNSSSDDLTVTASLASTIPIKITNTYDVGASGKGLQHLYFGSSGGSETTRLGGGTPASNIQITLPSVTGTLATLAGTETFTNKTLTSPSMTTPTMTGPIVQTSAMNLQVGQIAFPATQNASAGANTLDDYEEGTFAITMSASTSGSITINTSFNTGAYQKIGNKVTVTGQISVSSVSSPVGDIQINGLPFAVGSGSELSTRTAVALRCDGLTASAATSMQGYIIGSSSTIVVEVFSAGASAAAASAVQAGTAITFMATYFV